MFKFSYGMKL